MTDTAEQLATSPADSSNSSSPISVVEQDVHTTPKRPLVERPLPSPFKVQTVMPAQQSMVEEDEVQVLEEPMPRSRSSRKLQEPTEYPENIAKKAKTSIAHSPTRKPTDGPLLRREEQAMTNVVAKLMDQLIQKNVSHSVIETKFSEMNAHFMELYGELRGITKVLQQHTEILGVHGKRADEWLAQTKRSEHQSQTLLEKYQAHNNEGKDNSVKACSTLDLIKRKLDTLCGALPRIEGYLIGTGRCGMPAQGPIVLPPTDFTNIPVKEKPAVKAKEACLFCKKMNHTSDKCLTFGWYIKRKQRVAQLGLCYKCLKPTESKDPNNHVGCPLATKKCAHCAEFVSEPAEAAHHEWLCRLSSSEDSKVNKKEKKEKIEQKPASPNNRINGDKPDGKENRTFFQ